MKPIVMGGVGDIHTAASTAATNISNSSSRGSILKGLQKYNINKTTEMHSNSSSISLDARLEVAKISPLSVAGLISETPSSRAIKAAAGAAVAALPLLSLSSFSVQNTNTTSSTTTERVAIVDDIYCDFKQTRNNSNDTKMEKHDEKITQKKNDNVIVKRGKMTSMVESIPRKNKHVPSLIDSLSPPEASMNFSLTNRNTEPLLRNSYNIGEPTIARIESKDEGTLPLSIDAKAVVTGRSSRENTSSNGNNKHEHDANEKDENKMILALPIITLKTPKKKKKRIVPTLISPALEKNEDSSSNKTITAHYRSKRKLSSPQNSKRRRRIHIDNEDNSTTSNWDGALLLPKYMSWLSDDTICHLASYIPVVNQYFNFCLSSKDVWNCLFLSSRNAIMSSSSSNSSADFPKYGPNHNCPAARHYETLFQSAFGTISLSNKGTITIPSRNHPHCDNWMTRWTLKTYLRVQLCHNNTSTYYGGKMKRMDSWWLSERNAKETDVWFFEPASWEGDNDDGICNYRVDGEYDWNGWVTFVGQDYTKYKKNYRSNSSSTAIGSGGRNNILSNASVLSPSTGQTADSSPSEIQQRYYRRVGILTKRQEMESLLYDNMDVLTERGMSGEEYGCGLLLQDVNGGDGCVGYFGFEVISGTDDDCCIDNDEEEEEEGWLKSRKRNNKLPRGMGMAVWGDYGGVKLFADVDAFLPNQYRSKRYDSISKDYLSSKKRASTRIEKEQPTALDMTTMSTVGFTQVLCVLHHINPINGNILLFLGFADGHVVSTCTTPNSTTTTSSNGSASAKGSEQERIATIIEQRFSAHSNEVTALSIISCPKSKRTKKCVLLSGSVDGTVMMYPFATQNGNLSRGATRILRNFSNSCPGSLRMSALTGVFSILGFCDLDICQRDNGKLAGHDHDDTHPYILTGDSAGKVNIWLVKSNSSNIFFQEDEDDGSLLMAANLLDDLSSSNQEGKRQQQQEHVYHMQTLLSSVLGSSGDGCVVTQISSLILHGCRMIICGANNGEVRIFCQMKHKQDDLPKQQCDSAHSYNPMKFQLLHAIRTDLHRIECLRIVHGDIILVSGRDDFSPLVQGYDVMNGNLIGLIDCSHPNDHGFTCCPSSPPSNSKKRNQKKKRKAKKSAKKSQNNPHLNDVNLTNNDATTSAPSTGAIQIVSTVVSFVLIDKLNAIVTMTRNGVIQQWDWCDQGSNYENENYDKLALNCEHQSDNHNSSSTSDDTSSSAEALRSKNKEDIEKVARHQSMDTEKTEVKRKLGFSMTQIDESDDLEQYKQYNSSATCNKPLNILNACASTKLSTTRLLAKTSLSNDEKKNNVSISSLSAMHKNALNQEVQHNKQELEEEVNVAIICDKTRRRSSQTIDREEFENNDAKRSNDNKWTCSVCTFLNFKGDHKCTMCFKGRRQRRN